MLDPVTMIRLKRLALARQCSGPGADLMLAPIRYELVEFYTAILDGLEGR